MTAPLRNNIFSQMALASERCVADCVGREGHGLPQQPDGLVVLMLVDQLRGSNAQRISRLRLWRRRCGTRPEQERHARGAVAGPIA